LPRRQNHEGMNRLGQFLFYSALGLLVSCSSPPSEAAKQETPTTIEEETKPEAKPIKKAGRKRPIEGNVKEFFEAYGSQHPETRVLLKTRLGDIEIQLHEDTPLHRANFLYNINEGLYQNTIFYRVVPQFMIQGGNSDHDITLEKRKSNTSYYVPNEVKDHHLHTRGALAMAMSYTDNPDLKSAQYSYYIVIGAPFTDRGLDAVEEEYQIEISENARSAYRKLGGSPHLDQIHTVFGHVVKGMEVVEAIANEKRDSGDWPIHDVVISYEILDL
jgi:peptidyl-prolyl cis-trans isomerase A (cyclophilin A)